MKKYAVLIAVVLVMGIAMGLGPSKANWWEQKPHFTTHRATAPKEATTWKLNENFDASDSLPPGWTTIDGDGDGYAWFIYSYNAHSEPHSAGSYYNSSGNNDWLITPPVSIDAGDTLYFWFAAQDPDWCNEHLQVLISTSTVDTADFDEVILDTVLSDTSWHPFVYDLSAYDGQTIYIAFRNIGVDMFILKIDDVQIGQLPPCDAQISAVDSLSPFIDPGSEYTPMANVTNLGSNPLDATAVCYVIHQDDTISVDTAEVSGVPYGETQLVTFPTITLDLLDAVYQVVFEVFAAGDSNFANNSDSTYVFTYTTPRAVLFQEFTATGCTWCPYPAVALHRLKLELGDSVAIASYHIWGASYHDPFWYTAGDTIAAYYGVSGIPSTACNGSLYMIGGSTGDVDTEYVMYSYVYDAIAATKTPIVVDVDIPSVTETGFDVEATVTVVGEILGDPDIRLHYVITETNIPYHWDPGTIPLDSLFDVVRVTLPDIWGVPVTGSEFTDTRHIDLDPSWDANNCYLIAFVQDGINGEVYYAVEKKIEPSDVKESRTPGALKLTCAPNPFNPTGRVEVYLPDAGRMNLTIYDITGRPIRTLADGMYSSGTHAFTWDGKDDLSNPVASGVYFVRLSAGGKELTHKVALIR